MKKTENQFRERLVRDLERRGVKVFSLGQGTMDLWFNDAGLFAEIKKAGVGVFRRWGYEKLFCISQLNEEQTRMIRETGRVVVIAFDDYSRYWLWTPRELERISKARAEYKTLLWGRTADDRPFDHPLTYRELLRKSASLKSREVAKPE